MKTAGATAFIEETDGTLKCEADGIMELIRHCLECCPTAETRHAVGRVFIQEINDIISPLAN